MTQLQTCPECGQPFCPDCGVHYPGHVGAVNAGPSNTQNRPIARPGPYVPWGTLSEYRTDTMPGLETASWGTIDPHSGQALIKGPINRVVKLLEEGGGPNSGYAYLGGWNEQQVRALVESWIRQTWATPWAMLQTIPEAEEEVGFLFVAWILGWDIKFSGKAWQPCSMKNVKDGDKYQRVPTGYVWDPFRRACVKAGTQILNPNARAGR